LGLHAHHTVTLLPPYSSWYHPPLFLYPLCHLPAAAVLHSFALSSWQRPGVLGFGLGEAMPSCWFFTSPLCGYYSLHSFHHLLSICRDVADTPHTPTRVRTDSRVARDVHAIAGTRHYSRSLPTYDRRHMDIRYSPDHASFDVRGMVVLRSDSLTLTTLLYAAASPLLLRTAAYSACLRFVLFAFTLPPRGAPRYATLTPTHTPPLPPLFTHTHLHLPLYHTLHLVFMHTALFHTHLCLFPFLPLHSSCTACTAVAPLQACGYLCWPVSTHSGLFLDGINLRTRALGTWPLLHTYTTHLHHAAFCGGITNGHLIYRGTARLRTVHAQDGRLSTTACSRVHLSLGIPPQPHTLPPPLTHTPQPHTRTHTHLDLSTVLLHFLYSSSSPTSPVQAWNPVGS